MRNKKSRLLSMLLCTIITIEMLFGNDLLVNATQAEYQNEEESLISTTEDLLDEETQTESGTTESTVSENTSDLENKDDTEEVSEENFNSDNTNSSECEEFNSEEMQDHSDSAFEGELIADRTTVLPTRISLSPSTSTIYPGEFQDIKVTLSPTNITDKRIQYVITDSQSENVYLFDSESLSSENFFVQFVNGYIRVTSKLPSYIREDLAFSLDAYIYSTYDETTTNLPLASATIVLKPDILAESITIRSEKTNYSMNEYFRLYTDLEPVNVTNCDITWKVVKGESTMDLEAIANYEVTSEDKRIVKNNGNGNFYSYLDTNTDEEKVTIYAYNVVRNLKNEIIHIAGDKMVITVNKGKEDPPNPNVSKYVISNITPTLESVSLDDAPGWEWVEPNMKLTPFVNDSFSAPIKYTGSDYNNVIGTAQVQIINIQGIQLDSDVYQKHSDFVTFDCINYHLIGPSPYTYIPNSDYRVKFKVTGSNVREVTYNGKECVNDPTIFSNNYEASHIYVTTNEAGMFSVTVTLELLKDGKVVKTFTDSKKFTAGNSKFEDIVIRNDAGTNFSIAENELESGSAEVMYVKPQPGETQSFVIRALPKESPSYNSGVEVPAFKITSNNSKIAKISNVTNENCSTHAIVTIKGPGTVVLTATGNDSVKSSKSVILIVKDYTPTIGKQNEVLNTKNLAKNYGVKYEIVPNYDEVICSIEIDESKNIELAENFCLSYDNSCIHVALKTDDTGSIKTNPFYGTTKNIKLPVKITYEVGSTQYQFLADLELKCKATSVKLQLKVTEKLNLFYTDSLGTIEFMCPGVTDPTQLNLELLDCNYELQSNHLTEQDGKYVIRYKCKENNGKDKTGTLLVTEPESELYITQNITIDTINVAPKIKSSVSKHIIYTRTFMDYGVVKLLDSTDKPFILTESAKVEVISGREYASLYTECINESWFSFEVDENILKKKTATIKYEIQDVNWAKPIVLSLKIMVSSKLPKLKASKTTITLNCNEELMDQELEVVSFTADNELMFIDKVYGCNAASQAVLKNGIMIDDSNYIERSEEQLSIYFNKKVKKGTYKFKVTAILGSSYSDILEISTIITVKVVDIDPSKVFTVKTSGSINIMDEKNIGICCKPILKGITGKINYITYDNSEFGEFDVHYGPDGGIYIKAYDNEYYNPKITYHVTVIAYVQTPLGGRRVCSQKIGFKIKQPSITYKVQSDKQQYSNKQSSLTATYKVTANVPYYHVTSAIQEKTDACELFEITSSTYENKVATYIISSKNPNKLQSGKIYHIPVEMVYYNGNNKITKKVDLTLKIS